MQGCAGAAWSTAAGRGVVRAADSRLVVCFDNRRWRRAVPDAPAASRAAQAAGRRAGYAAGGAAVKKEEIWERDQRTFVYMYRILQQTIQAPIQALSSQRYGVELAQLEVELPPKLEFGEMALPVAFALAQRMKKAP